MKKIFVTTSILIVMLLLAGTVFGITGTVNTEGLNLRSSASTSSDVITQLDEGTKVEILDELDEWYKVSVGGNTGYVSKQYIKADNNAGTTVSGSTGSGDTNTVNANTVNPSTANTVTNSVDTSGNEFSGNTDNGVSSGGNQTEETNTNHSNMGKGTISQDVTVYVLPLLNSTQISTLSTNTEVDIISEVGNWKYVMTDTVAGWILASKVESNNSAEPNDTKGTNQNNENGNNVNTNNDTNGTNLNNENANGTNSNNENNNQTNSNNENNQTNTNNNQTSNYPTKMSVNVDAVNVREQASTDSEIVTSVEQNTSVNVTGESGDWYKVEVNGTKGYIKKEFLS